MEKIMRLFLTVIFTCQVLFFFSQDELGLSENKTFEFRSENKRSVKFNFRVEQQYVNDTIFNFKGILCNDTSYLCGFKFSHSVNGLLVWNGKEWLNLFSKQKKMNKLYLGDIDKTISPQKIYTINGDTLFSFSCKNENVDFSTDNNLYYFSNSKGIIAVSNPEIFFKRDDYIVHDIKNNLTLINW